MTLSRDGDSVIGAIALVTGTLALVMLVSVPTGAAPDGAALREPVATVTSASTDLRARAVRTLGWRSLGPGAVVREDDSLFVPPGAEARLTFTDGTVLELDEKSLVVIEARRAGARRVAVRQGSVLGRTAQGALELAARDGLARVPTDAEARLDLTSGSAQVSVFKGTASVGSAALAAGQRASLENERLVPLAPWPVQLAAPEMGFRRFFHGTPPPLELTWTGAAAGDRIQVARDKGFAFVLDEASAAEGSLPFGRAEAGVFWWRVVDEQGSPRSEARRFSLLEDVPPVQLTPAEGEVALSTESAPMVFRWTQVRGITRYRVELSREAAFPGTDFSQVVDAVQLRVHVPLDEGTWYWRVRAAETGHEDAPPSAPHGFRLVHKPLLQAPELLAPEIEVKP